jgi:hypothetical protein
MDESQNKGAYQGLSKSLASSITKPANNSWGYI